MEIIKELILDFLTTLAQWWQSFRIYRWNIGLESLSRYDLVLLLDLTIKMYIIMILKEFFSERLYLNYTRSFGTAFKTTIYLLLIPVTSMFLIFHYLLIDIRSEIEIHRSKAINDQKNGSKNPLESEHVPLIRSETYEGVVS